MIRAILAALVLASPLAAQAQSGPQIESAWARATPGQAKNGAAYATIAGGAEADNLVAVASPVAGRVEIHVHTHEDGVMKMRPVDAVAVPAGGKAELKPGSYHIMLLDLKRPLKVGDTFPLTLTFERAGATEVTVTVEKPGAMGPSHGGAHGGHGHGHGAAHGKGG
jgi:periplasmic copper chaperone A